MFQAILMTQWKWARLPLLAATVMAFALPVLSVQPSRAYLGATNAGYVMASMQGWALWYPLLAAAAGLLLAMSAWSHDHRLGHIYALSLPLPRWRFSLLRLGAGLVLLSAPVIAITAGSLAAIATTDVPTGLTGYPLALAMRFALAAVSAFTIFFAISAGSARTAGYVLAGIAILVLGEYGLSTGPSGVSLIEFIMDWPGPLAIFTGRWMLIDV